jgi:uncharacterized protein (DUF2126 family)/transglutaminase-like putative cysteine protease
MAIRVALHHLTEYHYDRLVALGPQVVRLRPAPHCRTPVISYSLKIEPGGHFINWQQDPHGNFLARLVFPDRTTLFRVEVDLVADLSVINPFDFFIEESAEQFPFRYDPELAVDLIPFLERLSVGPLLQAYLKEVDASPRKTIDFLVDLNRKLQRDVKYLIRMEPGVQTSEETLAKRSGSCRDSAWLLIQILRSFGLAARFVSGYLIQLTPDVKPLDGPEGPPADFTDLHAWAEVYLPGAGWVGLDPTSGLLTGEGHLPLAATPIPQTAAPISGAVDKAEVDFRFSMKVQRIHEDPRVTKPYTEEQWSAIDGVGKEVDGRLRVNDIRLTMGGEPTFVSIDDMEGAEWNTAAVGVMKQELSTALINRLRARFAPGGLLHFGQGKWYPGESLPRWAFSCIWRTDGQPIWTRDHLLAGVDAPGKSELDQAGAFLHDFAERIGVDGQWIRPVYEDVWEVLRKERKLPVDVDPRQFDLEDDEDRRRLAKLLERGINQPAGYVLPLTKAWWQARPTWTSGPWPVRTDRVFLLPGDSPIGLRLPLESLPVSGPADRRVFYPVDPMAPRDPLPGYAELRQTLPTRALDQPATPITGQVRGATLLEAGERPAEEWATAGVVRTAMCAEVRQGRLHVFMPPVQSLEDYLEVVGVVEQTAEAMNLPVVLEGYLPPFDPRINLIKVTPDPGVIEVNIHPARDWEHLKEITTGIYEEARLTRLGTEKFQLDGRHSGTGGGNHIVLGGPTPSDSPFLRRPDLLRSLLGYWNNHPSLSYLFAGQFVGPTSQAPRIDEGRCDAIYELELAFRQISEDVIPLPYLVDRVFRHLLVDITGNTHRAEFCIDKLFSPDSSTGRLGLVEMRAFEMPPHARMSLTQQLLVRALIALFWERPYREKLTRWGTALHDRFMLPHFLWLDFRDVIRDLNGAGIAMREEWFVTHFEFRCPLIGEIVQDGVHLELRSAIEPWYVLGEEPGGGGATRYVDSSVERMQALVRGLNAERFAITCNGWRVPLQPTGTTGEFVAGVRYRAWQPPSCLHPTIPVNTPLVYDIFDIFNARSIGGCKYHVDHPGGVNPPVYPINALEAESRRAGRFFKIGHTPGTMAVREIPPLAEYPCTLDLRQVAGGLS